METEGKAKVGLVGKIVQFFAALAVLPRSFWKKLLSAAGLFRNKRLNSTISFISTETKR